MTGWAKPREQLESCTTGYWHWEELLGSLLANLKDSCSEPTADVEALEEIWQDFFAGNDSALPDTLSEYLQANHKMKQPGEVRRLFGNVKALIATAGAARCWALRAERCGDTPFLEWCRRSAGLLDGVTDTEALFADSSAGADYRAPAEALSSASEPLAATAFWIEWWLAGAAPASRSAPWVEVPFAVVCKPAGHVPATGYIAHFAVRKAGAGKGRVFAHPRSALLLADEAWLGALEQLVRPEDGALCWSVEPGAIPPALRYFSGDSHGGAVALAFHHCRHGQRPDGRILVLATARPTNGWPGNEEAILLDRVLGIREKIIAASEQPIDTIAVVPDDEQAALPACAEHHLSLAVLRPDGVEYIPPRPARPDGPLSSCASTGD